MDEKIFKHWRPQQGPLAFFGPISDVIGSGFFETAAVVEPPPPPSTAGQLAYYFII